MLLQQTPLEHGILLLCIGDMTKKISWSTVKRYFGSFPVYFRFSCISPKDAELNFRGNHKGYFRDSRMFCASKAFGEKSPARMVTVKPSFWKLNLKVILYARECLWYMTRLDCFGDVFTRQWHTIDFFWPNCTCIEDPLNEIS